MQMELLADMNEDLSTRKHFQSLKFSAATRRLPLLLFWIFMGVTVLVAGVLAHDRTTLQTFWNKEAVMQRKPTLQLIPFGLFFDSLATKVNRIFVKGGWIVAGILIILVQSFYIGLVMVKRDRVPALQFIRHFKINRMIAIESAVILAATFFFLLCTWSFNKIAQSTGSCTLPDGSFSFPVNISECQAVFRGFDISGHCFLIVHSCLLTLEYAAKVLFVWHTREMATVNIISNDKDSDLESVKEFESSSPAPSSADDQLKSNNFFNRNHKIFQVILVCLLTLVLLLCSLEFLVFMQTILFYHTVLEKVLGTIIGASFWAALFILSLKYPHLF